MVSKDMLYKEDGLLWVIEKKSAPHEDEDRVSVGFAVCPKEELRVKLDYDEQTQTLTCPSCKFSKKLEIPYRDKRELVNKKYNGSLLSNTPVKSLDLLETSVTDENSDDNFWIRAKLGEKDGKRQAVVWIGDKKNKIGEKIHFFIDVEDEQLRFDKTNINPSEIIAAVKVSFKDSTTERKLND